MGKMTIKTRFAVGDDVWFVYDNREKHGTIHSIEIKVKSLVTIKYVIKLGFSTYLVACDECNVYPSLENLLKKNKNIKKYK
jgi:hypothetical protein